MYIHVYVVAMAVLFSHSQSGFSHMLILFFYSVTGWTNDHQTNPLPILIMSITCRGFESSLQNCAYSTEFTSSGLSICYRKARAYCYNDPSGNSFI